MLIEMTWCLSSCGIGVRTIVAWGCGENISSGGRWKGVVDDLTGGVLERVSESR